MKKQHKFSIWYALLAIWGVLILHNLLVSLFAVKAIPYSEFMKLVKDKKVAEVAISDNTIQGKLTSDESGSGNPALSEPFGWILIYPVC